MQRYSHFFSTLHDELQPVGKIGRGTHYSVLRAVLPSLPATFHDFAIIWDEDHDLRVIWVIEQIYAKSLLAPVLFIGERKGSLTVLTKALPSEEYRKQIEAITTSVPSDSFSSTVEAFTSSTGDIISDDEGRVRAYLGGLSALWSLGSKKPEFTTTPFLVTSGPTPAAGRLNRPL